MATRENSKSCRLEELVMVGYPIGLSDTRNNYPIFRKGYTSAHPAVDFNDDGIGLVDMACFPGSSGSPIFILNEGGYRDKRGNFILEDPEYCYLEYFMRVHNMMQEVKLSLRQYLRRSKLLNQIRA